MRSCADFGVTWAFRLEWDLVCRSGHSFHSVKQEGENLYPGLKTTYVLPAHGFQRVVLGTRFDLRLIATCCHPHKARSLPLNNAAGSILHQVFFPSQILSNTHDMYDASLSCIIAFVGAYDEKNNVTWFSVSVRNCFILVFNSHCSSRLVSSLKPSPHCLCGYDHKPKENAGQCCGR